MTLTCATVGFDQKAVSEVPNHGTTPAPAAPEGVVMPEGVNTAAKPLHPAMNLSNFVAPVSTQVMSQPVGLVSHAGGNFHSGRSPLNLPPTWNMQPRVVPMPVGSPLNAGASPVRFARVLSVNASQAQPQFQFAPRTIPTEHMIAGESAGDGRMEQPPEKEPSEAPRCLDVTNSASSDAPETVIEEIRLLILELTSRASKESESAIQEARLMIQELRQDVTSLQSQVDALTAEKAVFGNTAAAQHGEDLGQVREMDEMRSCVQMLADELASERAAREAGDAELSLALEGATAGTLELCSNLEQRVINEVPSALSQQSQALIVGNVDSSVHACVDEHFQGVREQHQSELQLLHDDLQQKQADFHASVSDLSGQCQAMGSETRDVLIQPQAAEADAHAVISEPGTLGVDNSERQPVEAESVISERHDIGADTYVVNNERQDTEAGSVISERQVSGADVQAETSKPKGSWWQRLSTAQRLSSAASSKVNEAQATPLQVSILGATGLRIADWTHGDGKSDPYCICELKGKSRATKIQTEVVYHDTDPTWNHEAILTDYVVGDSLVFKVYDVDYISLGYLVLPSEKFHPQGFEGELPLEEAGEGVSAVLRLKIQPAAGEEAADNDWEAEY